MEIERAKRCKVGDVVHVPADRGDPAGWGKVKHIGGAVAKTLNGTEYVWITVRHNGLLHSSVWSSNRLG